jgi:hypothetical protein
MDLDGQSEEINDGMDPYFYYREGKGRSQNLET